MKTLSDSVHIRPAVASDLPAINDIYNHYVIHSTCTYQEEPESLEGRQRWFEEHGAGRPVLVAEAESRVVGWGSLSNYHDRSAFRHTAENSVYVHHACQRRGIGSLLLQELVVEARRLGIHVIVAAIDGGQKPSVELHAKFGFERVGHLKEVGFKFGRWLDVVYMELRVTGNADLKAGPNQGL